MRFQIKQRVRISPDYHWAQGATGTIAPHIEEHESPSRPINTTSGTVNFYWVEFDEGHIDADGDGPYRAAEIDERVLVPLDDDS